MKSTYLKALSTDYEPARANFQGNTDFIKKEEIMSFRPNHFFVKNREISRIPLLKNATKSYDVIHSALRATLAPGRQEPEVIFIYDS